MDKQLLKAARDAMGKGNNAEALGNVEQILQGDPTNYTALVFKGKIQGELGKQEEATKAYKSAISSSPSQPLAWTGLNQLYAKTGDLLGQAESLLALKGIFAELDDQKKYQETLATLWSLHEEEKAGRKPAMAFWRSLLTDSSYQKDASNKPRLEVLLKLLGLEEAEEKAAIEKTYDNERKSVRATKKPEQILRDVTMDIQQTSNVNSVYFAIFEESVPSEQAPRVQALREKFVARWSLSVQAENDPQKKKEKRERLLRECKKVLESPDVRDPIPFELVIESFADDQAVPQTQIQERYAQTFPQRTLAKTLVLEKLLSENKTQEAQGKLGELTLTQGDLLAWKIKTELCLKLQDHQGAVDALQIAKEALTAYNQKTGASTVSFAQKLEMLLAAAYVQLGRKYWVEAERIFDATLQTSPDDLQARLGLSSILLSQKRFAEAAANIEKISARAPASGWAQAEMGWLQFEQKRLQEASEELQKAISLDGSNAVFHARLGRVYWEMGGEHRQNKKFSQARLLKAVQLDPNYGPCYTTLGHYYVQGERDYTRGKKCYQKALTLSPTDEEAGVHLADLYILENQIDLALSLYKKVTDEDPKAAWAWKRIGYYELIRKGNFEEAGKSFQTALRVDSGDHSCWEGLGECYKFQGKYVASLKAFTKALELFPTSVNSQLQIALIKQKLGMADESIVAFQSVLKVSEGNIPALFGLAQSFLASAREHYQLGAYGSAADRLSQGLGSAVQMLAHLAPGQAAQRIKSIWKIIGDLCCFFAKIPAYTSQCHIQTLRQLVQLAGSEESSPEINTILGAEQFPPLHSRSGDEFGISDVLALGSLAFRCLLAVGGGSEDNGGQKDPGHALSWGDLAVSYLLRIMTTAPASAEEGKWLHAATVKALRMSLTIDSSQWALWNSLGVLTLTQEPKLSQHAFIRALQQNSKSAISWTNLGFLYFHLKEWELALKCFSNAQILDPEWAYAWLGQGLTSKSANSAESTSLLQHASDLSNGAVKEANFLFAQESFHQSLASSHSLQFSDLVPPTSALTKIVEQYPNDAAFWNLLGLLSEQQGLLSQAANSFSRSLRVLQQTAAAGSDLVKVRAVKANFGRVLCAQGLFKESIASLIDLEGLDVDTRLVLGIAYFFDRQLDKSMKEFETAFSSATDSGLRTEAVVLICQILWALGTPQHRALARQELFKQAQGNPEHLKTLLSLASLGLCEGDFGLMAAALGEVSKLTPDSLTAQDPQGWVPLVFSKFFLLQGNTLMASSYLQRAIRSHPGDPVSWARHSAHCLNSLQKGGGTASLYAAKVSEKLSSPAWAPISLSTAEVSHIQQLLSLNSVATKEIAGDGAGSKTLQGALSSAQRSLRLRPSDIGSWVTFAAALKAHCSLEITASSRHSQSDATRLEALLFSLQGTLQHIDALSQAPSFSTKPARVPLVLWSRLMLSSCLSMRASLMTEGSELRTRLAKEALAMATEVSGVSASQPTLRAQSLILSARCHLLLGTWKESVALVKAAIQSCPLLLLGYQELSELYFSRRLFSAADFALRLGLSQQGLAPGERYDLFLRLARVAWHSGTPEVGLESVGEAIKIRGDSAAPRWLQGILHLRLGNNQKAIRAFANAKERETGGLFLNLALARSHAEKGEEEQARQYLKLEEDLQPLAKVIEGTRALLLSSSKGQKKQ